jgi:peptide/nickel transport system substrate-binding protein
MSNGPRRTRPESRRLSSGVVALCSRVMGRTPTWRVPGPRLLGLVIALVALGLLLASGSATPARAAGPKTLKISLFAGIENLDPGRAYYTIDWQLLNPVCAKLVTYPDRPAPDGFRVQPEVATAMPSLSADGKTYTFHIRNDFTFSSGEKVTAQTFKSVIDRVASPSVGSPGAWLLSDIAGLKDVNQGNASSVSGVVASGDTLTITLTHPSGDFLNLLALPFSCAMPLQTPKSPVVSAFASAGPYYIDSYIPDQSIVLKPNPYYAGSRPRYFDEIDYTLGVQQDQAYLQLLNGQLDYAADGLPSTAHEAGSGLYDQYGPGSPAAALGRQRYFVNPTQIIDFLALNTSAGRLFANVKLRQAVNYALNRASIAALRGLHAATPTAQYLPAAIPGFRDDTIYPLDGPDLAKAQQLIAAAGGPPASPIVLYASSSTVAQNQTPLIAAELEAVGFSVDVHSFASGLLTRCGTRGEPFDLCSAGWAAEYPDPYDFLQLFDGRTIQDVQNNNISYFDDSAYIAKLDAAQALSGEARYAAFGDLDVELARDSAPWAALDYRNIRELFSDRVGGQIYQPAYGSIDLAALYVRPGISLEDVRLDEGNSGGTTAVFTVSLSSVESGPVTVDYATADETATSGSDYTATSGTLTIPAGERSATVSVPVNSDTSFETDETFRLTLTNPSSGTLTAAFARATIVNDDAAPLPSPPGAAPPPPPAPNADLALSISDRPDPARVGKPLTYTLTVSNAGPAAANGVTLGLILPRMLALRSLTASQGSCIGTRCQIGAIPAGGGATVTLVVLPRAVGIAQLQASASGVTADPSGANNSGREQTSVRAALRSVPNLKGKTLAAAHAALVRALCTLGKVRRAYSTRVKAGHVISQAPRAGAQVARGTKVNLVLSRGRRH